MVIIFITWRHPLNDAKINNPKMITPSNATSRMTFRGPLFIAAVTEINAQTKKPEIYTL